MSTTLCANWQSGSLYLWAVERAAPGERVLEPGSLRALVGELSSDPLLASAVKEGTLGLLLPGAAEPVRVPALVLESAEAIDLLTSLRAPVPATCGPTIQYWATLARFVCDLIARRQFVPRIDDSQQQLHANWRLLVSDRAQLAWLERFAAAMPAACLASSGAAARSPVDSNGNAIPANGAALAEPAQLVENFLAGAADALVRRAVAADPFFQTARERAALPAATPEVRWLSALLGNDRIIRIDDSEQRAAFVQQAQAWLGQLDDSNPATMRLALVLHEPVETPEQPDAPQTEGEADTWVLTLHLQGIDGEGELIDAASLWEQGQEHAPILGRSIARRQAALLAELARAAEVYPLLGPLLNHPAPGQLSFSTNEAHAFIRHWSGLLRERGVGVILPQWTLLPDEEIGLRLELDPLEELDDLLETPSAGHTAPRPGDPGAFDLSSGHFGLDSLMTFNWRVAVGNMRLAPDEFEKLVAQSAPLVRYKGRWIQLDLDAAKKAVEFVKQRPTGHMSLAEAFRTAFTASRARTGLNVIGLGGSSWIEKLLEQTPVDQMQRIAQPEGFKGDLRPYQLRGLHWLAFLDRLGLGACLADDMGLGKTIQLIVLMQHERERQAAGGGARPGPTLLFVPTSVVGNWLREAQRFAPEMKVMVHHGAERLAGEAFRNAATQADLVITSYSLAYRDREDLASVSWWRITLDEAQKIKNPAAAATMAIRSIFAPRRVALTGTPIENHLSELWSIMEVLNPGLLGTAADFREKFAVPIEKLGEKERAEQLRRMIRPFILRRTKADPMIAGDLPEKLEMKVFCNLTADQAALYERYVSDSLRQIDSASGIRRRGLILATLTRLKQICNHPALVESAPGALDSRSGKCERLIDMLEELLEEGDGALVFTQFREMGHLLERMIPARLGEQTLFLHGGTPAKMRDVMIQRFQQQEKGAPRIFLLSLRAGGLGLNLTAANHVFHFDRWWNPAVEQQATDRAHRVGQTRTVQVHKFVCIGTMEERIDKMLTEKMALAEQIVGAGDEWLTNLSTEQLKQYLSLSREAVGEFE